MQEYDLTVIIVNWNSGKYLQNCVKSIENSKLYNYSYEIIIIDNCSSDNSLSLIEKKKNVILIKNSKNVGFGKACNQGVSVSNSDIILFLNPDVLFADNILFNSVNFYKKSDYAVLGIKQIDENGIVNRTCARNPNIKNILNQSLGLSNINSKIFLSYKMSDWNHLKTKEVDHVIGSFYLISKEIFKCVGGFDEDFFLYYEDYDLSLKIRKLNKKIIFWADEFIVHKGGASSEQILAKRLFFSQKSKLIFFKKHFSLFDYAIIFFIIVFLEFFVRLIKAVFTLRFKEIIELFVAYFLLLKSFFERHEN